MSCKFTCSFLSFLSGLRDWRGESSSGIWSGGCDMVCRLLASFSRSFSSARAVVTHGDMDKLVNWRLQSKEFENGVHTIHTSATQTFASETAFELRCWTIDRRLLRLVHGAAWIAKFGSKFWKQTWLNGFRCHQTEKCVMLDASFPQFFRSTMVGQFEANRRFILLKFTGTNFYVEIVTFIRNLQNFRPCKAIDA